MGVCIRKISNFAVKSKNNEESLYDRPTDRQTEIKRYGIR